MLNQDMESKFGAYVTADAIPSSLILAHMMNLCSLPHPAREELTINVESVFYQQLQGGFKELGQRKLTSDEQQALGEFNKDIARCIVIKQFDAADKPEESQVTLASCRRQGLKILITLPS